MNNQLNTAKKVGGMFIAAAVLTLIYALYSGIRILIVEISDLISYGNFTVNTFFWYLACVSGFILTIALAGVLLMRKNSFILTGVLAALAALSFIRWISVIISVISRLFSGYGAILLIKNLISNAEYCNVFIPVFLLFFASLLGSFKLKKVASVICYAVLPVSVLVLVFDVSERILEVIFYSVYYKLFLYHYNIIPNIFSSIGVFLFVIAICAIALAMIKGFKKENKKTLDEAENIEEVTVQE